MAEAVNQNRLYAIVGVVVVVMAILFFATAVGGDGPAADADAGGETSEPAH